MEIKYTIEILTKDIQDIEKLVGNLQNYQDGSAIEMDLALSKLRNVYEILTMIKADRLNEFFALEKTTVQAPAPDPQPVVEMQPPAQPPTAVEVQPQAEPEPVAEVQPQAEPEQADEVQPQAEPEPAEKVQPQAEVKPVTEVTTPAGNGTRKAAEILAEKFSAESSINENLAGQRAKKLDSRVTGQSIDNITRNIGINDRFLIIRELFNGDSEKFSSLLNKLDTAGNYQNALSLLKLQFSGSMEHGGVEILAGLIKRRYIQQ